MFNLDNFKIMLLKNNYTFKTLAESLNVSMSSIYRRIKDGGNFTVEEVRVMVNIFGKEDVFNALFYSL